MEKSFIDFFARILEKDVSEVSMELSYEDGAWDSLMHIRLVAGKTKRKIVRVR